MMFICDVNEQQRMMITIHVKFIYDLYVQVHMMRHWQIAHV